MTAASNLRIVPFLSVFASLLLSLTISFRPEAATTQRIVVDRHSGIALGGFDPVAYLLTPTPYEEKANSSTPSRG